ncbi:MAG: hypothetical protein ACKVK8_06265, partial [Rhodospirillales bacterium]
DHFRRTDHNCKSANCRMEQIVLASDYKELYGEDDALPFGCEEWKVLYFEMFDIYEKEVA